MINNLPKSLIEAAEKHLTHIDVDGELKHKYNSEGKLIHHTEDGIRNFHRWFGNSKVVDSQGRPKVVYHGTGADIHTFDNSKAPIGLCKNKHGAAWFSSAPEVAGVFAGQQRGESVCGLKLGHSNILPVYLKISNPVVDKFGRDYARGGGLKHGDMEELKSFGHDGVHYPQADVDLPDTTSNGPVQGYYRNRHGEAWGESENGYPDQYAVFHPHQIKSAIGNNGDFSNKPTIHESPAVRPFTQDEYGKNIVHDNGEYKISVNDPHDATYIALWHSGKAVGKMYMEAGKSDDTKGYATIRSVDIDKKHQGKGMGKQLYRTALQYVHDKYKGIGSEQPDRVNKKQVPAIFRRMGGKFHESGDFTIDRQQPLSESTDQLTFRSDNPGGDWLASKQQWAEEDMIKRGGKGYVGKGISGSTTGYFNKPVHLPVSHLMHLPGAEGEESFRNSSDNPKMKYLEDEIGHPDNFDSQKHPIFIGVNHKGDACIMEGNHRLAYAHKHGIKNIHTEVRYYNGGEVVTGHMHPSVIQALHQPLI